MFRPINTVMHRERRCAAQARRATEAYSLSTARKRNAAGVDAAVFECHRIYGTEHQCKTPVRKVHMDELDQAREDLRKTRFRATVYLLGGVGLSVIGVILVVLYVGKREIPSLMMGIVGIFWAAMLFYQMVKARELERAMRAKLDGMEESRKAGETLEPVPGSGSPPSTVGEQGEKGAPGGGSREP